MLRRALMWLSAALKCVDGGGAGGTAPRSAAGRLGRSAAWGAAQNAPALAAQRRDLLPCRQLGEDGQQQEASYSCQETGEHTAVACREHLSTLWLCDGLPAAKFHS